MKINFLPIIRDHWSTLYDAETGRVSYRDIILFYAAPLASAISAYGIGFSVKLESYNVSVTFFGIFIALLLNIQVAIFAIFQRKRVLSEEDRQSDIQNADIEMRRQLLRELNSNISYLIIIGSIALALFLFFFVIEMKDGIAPAIATALYTHFILIFLMIVKRSHALFQREYSDSLN